MKQIAILLILIILGSLSYLLIHGSASTKKQSDSILIESREANTTETLDGVNSETVVKFETQTYERFFPGEEEVNLVETQVPYVFSNGERNEVFDDITGLRIDEHLISPDGSLVYFSVGNGRQDAAVKPYIYDVQAAELHMVCTPEIDCSNTYFGFGGQHLIQVSWLSDSQLQIIFDNPGLAEGVSESGPTIGKQYFESTAVAPWIISEISLQ